MGKIVGICGITCSDCPAYIATMTDDDEKRKETAEVWSREFKAEIKPENINCASCLSADGPFFSHCIECEIRKCGMGREVENCAHCEDYACEKLVKFFDMVPSARATLDEIKQEL